MKKREINKEYSLDIEVDKIFFLLDLMRGKLVEIFNCGFSAFLRNRKNKRSL